MSLNRIIIFVVVLLIPHYSAAGDIPWDLKLPFKEAVVTYELSGMASGQEKLYIKDYGKRTARYRTTSTTVLGMTQTASTVEIVTPEWIYTFDLQEGAGTKSVNPRKLMIEEYRKLSAEERKRVDEHAETTAGAFTGGLQGTIEPNAKAILGYSCDRMTAMGTTVYTIHNSGIALLSESDFMGAKLIYKAIDVDTRETDDSRFSYPDGIVPRPSPEKDQMAAIMARQAIELMKGPEGHESMISAGGGMPSASQPAIPEEDKLQMQEAMKTIKGLFGN